MTATTKTVEPAQVRYQIAAAAVTFRVPRQPGDVLAGVRSARSPWKYVHGYQGALVPEDVNPGDLQLMLRRRTPGPVGPGRPGGKPLLVPVTVGADGKILPVPDATAEAAGEAPSARPGDRGPQQPLGVAARVRAARQAAAGQPAPRDGGLVSFADLSQPGR